MILGKKLCNFSMLIEIILLFKMWNTLILPNWFIESLNEVFPDLKYKAFANTSLMGLAIMWFCKNEVRSVVKYVNTSIVKTGFKGYVGNKGWVAARFIIDDISVVAGWCHLDWGAKVFNFSILTFNRTRNQESKV